MAAADITIATQPVTVDDASSMGIYVFSRDVLFETLDRDNAADFGREIIPAALGRYRVQSYVFDGYYIRSGIVIVPKDGVIRPGTKV